MTNSGNMYTADSNGCIIIDRSDVVGYNLDTLCIVKTDTVTGISDTTVVIISNLPDRDTIRDTNCVECIDTVCVPVESGMSADTVIVESCAGVIEHITYTIEDECVIITRDATVGYNVDTLCVVVCDSTQDICDTTVVIISTLPDRDTIRDTNLINTTDTICADIEAGMSNIKTTISDCTGAMNNSGNTYTADTNGCIIIDRSEVVGYNLDTLCIVKTDTVTGISDTTVVIISNLPERDTIRDTSCVECVDTVCVPVESGMSADTVIVESCAGVIEHITYTIEDECVVITRDATVGYNVDTLCVVVCDSSQDICDTTVVIISTLPERDTIRDTNLINTTDTLCVAVENGMTIDSIVIYDCTGGMDNSGNAYSVVAGTNCILIDRSEEVGYNLDTLCIITVDTTTGISDTTVVIISNLPEKDTIRDTNEIYTTDTICTDIEAGMSNIRTEIVDCAGAKDNSGNIYTVGADGCIIVERQGEVGYNLDTLCIVKTDTVTGITDTTVVIISNIPVEECPDWIRDTVIPCGGMDSSAYCIPLDLKTLQHFNVYIDGTKTAMAFSSASGCGATEVAGGYSFNANRYVDGVTHLLEAWGIDSTRRIEDGFTFTTLAELAAHMNGIDPAGAWFVDSLVVSAGNPSSLYSTGTGLQIFAFDPVVGTFRNEYNNYVTYSGSMLMLASGCHTVVLEDTLTGCSDTAQICIDCNDIIYDTTCYECPKEVCVDTMDVPGTVVSIETCADNDQVSIDSLNPCIIYTPVPGQLGNDTVCVVVCNEEDYCDTTIIIITVLPKVDTLRDTGEINSTETLCIAPDSGMHADEVSVTDCSGAIDHVTYTVTDSCVVITRDSVVGYNLDTLCVVICDTTMGVCDTTVVIISNEPRPECPDLIRDTILPCGGDETAYCIPIDLQTIQRYNLYVDGTQTAIALSLSNRCDPEVVISGYSYEANGYVDGEAYELEAWGIDSVRSISGGGFRFTTLGELALHMNSIDPVGGWYADGNVISAANPSALYYTGTGLQIWGLSSMRTYRNGFSDQTVYFGSTLMLEKGCHTVVLEDTLTGCRDSATICIDCGDVIVDTTCNECPVEICIDTTDLPGTIISIETCDGDPQVAIDSLDPCITYTPEPGQVGNDTLCIVVCDDRGNCDTTHIIITVLPKRDSIRDTGEVSSTKTLCVAADSGMNADTVYVIACYGAIDHVAYGVDENGCIELTRDTVSGYNIDTLCVVICDAAMGICDTTVVIISNIPPRDTIRETLPVNDRDSICGRFASPDGEVLVTDCAGEIAGTGNYIAWHINEDGCLVYTSGAFKGADTLCIKVCELGTDNCHETTVIITVTGIPPIAVNDDTTTGMNTPVVINVLDNDTATDSDPLELCNILIYPENGDVSVNYSTGEVTYIPQSNFVGVDSFQYEICDPDGNDTAWVYIRITEGEDCELYNAFSPDNGDDVNNTYYIPCIDASKGDVEVSIYNRWGIEVYHTLRYDNNSGWDGRYKGAPLPDGTYYYVIKYINRNDVQINKAGFIVIQR
jgi:gliding motility-associated-like protein